MKKFSIIIIILLVPFYLYAWTITDTFEGGAVGELADDTGMAYDGAGSATLYDSTANGGYVHAGNRSCKMTWPDCNGECGFLICKGIYNFTNTAGEGDEVWFRSYVYFQNDWDWADGESYGQCKFMRLRTNNGHLSIMAKNGFFYLSNEITSYDSSWESPIQTVAIDHGKWLCMEIYVKFSVMNGIIRMWKDGVLFATHEAATMDDGVSGTLAYLMSTWNSPGSPQMQSQWFDDVIITNEQPTNRDAAGNYMIGPTDWGTTPTSGSSGITSCTGCTGAGW
jgi:hypothetical protein